ncbi:MAG: winged helix-turn-helix domain-containing protein [Polaribacter sp.]|nr:winged helix-turn-helix domain-containing protein [Polaribacter sp.]
MMHKKYFSILFLVITVFCIWSFSDPETNKEPFSEKVKVVLREVGNQLLLSNKDSVSLILPVKELASNKYQISFEKQLSFKPNILVDIVKNAFEKASFSENYIVEVLQCSDHEVAYSYQIKNESEKDIIPCSGRFLPKNCYQIEVLFTNRNSGYFNRNTLLIIGFIVLFGWLFFVFYQRKSLEKKVEMNANFVLLGIFSFYPEQHKLMQKAKEISLSKKECELLEIFVANPNQIIKREELTKKVWEDNGVFVGRSLDTYISKLRKKLKEDTSIQLINIHGVGYKLEIK